MNHFISQGKGILNNVREAVADKWLQGSGQKVIAKEMRLDRQTVSNIISFYVTGRVKLKREETKIDKQEKVR